MNGSAESVDSFKVYIANRFQKQVEWYNDRSLKYRKRYYWLQCLVIGGATVVPILSANLTGNLKWITVAVSSGVAILLGFLNLFKYHEKWIRHRVYCEKLKHELYYFDQGVGTYANLKPAQKQKRFVEEIEALIEQEQKDWVKEHGRQSEPFMRTFR